MTEPYHPLLDVFKAGIEALIAANRSSGGPESLELLRSISPHQLAKLILYVELLSRWSSRVNLVADGSPEHLVERHVLDCAAAWAILKGRGAFSAPLLDIGSGGGLPGAVFSILEPVGDTVLCEPREKRSQFLLEVKRRLNLDHTAVQISRAEELAGRKFSLITARAVSSPSALLTVAEPLLVEGGVVALMVGPNFEQPESEKFKNFESIQYVLGDLRPRGLLLCR